MTYLPSDIKRSNSSDLVKFKLAEYARKYEKYKNSKYLSINIRNESCASISLKAFERVPLVMKEIETSCIRANHWDPLYYKALLKDLN